MKPTALCLILFALQEVIVAATVGVTVLATLLLFEMGVLVISLQRALKKD